jgi:DNA-binding transcriptional ArsR family regulator
MRTEEHVNSNLGPYDPQRLHPIMAGSGAPFSALTPLRKGLLRALHDRPRSGSELAAAFGMSRAEVESELEPLIEARLVQERERGYQPTFFIADVAETLRVAADARDTGGTLGRWLLGRWDDIRSAYEQLAISRDHAFRDVTFLLVGEMILDLGLLDALSRDGTLMARPPARPNPDHPEARYYFWMIEGDPCHLGNYGASEVNLDWLDWALLTFGQYYIDGAPNQARRDFVAEARDRIAAGQSSSPGGLAEILCVPIIGRADVTRWQECVRWCAEGLLKVYRGREDTLRLFYSTLHAGSYAPYGFGEFFCWYDHVAYGYALEELEGEGALSIPASRFAAALVYEGQDESGGFF